MSDPTYHEQIIANLERHGEAQVRLMIASGGFPTQLNATVLQWLSEKDREARRRNEASQAEQDMTAQSAKKAAWIAAIAAIVAAIVAIVASVISYLAWIYPHP